MLNKNNIINIKYNQNQPSITFGIIGEMNSGKSTLNNAIIGKDFCSTRFRRETLSQIIIRHNYNLKPLDENSINHIREQIKGINKNTKEELCENKNTIDEIQELVINDNLIMIKDLISTKLKKNSVEIFDTMGFNDKNTDPKNYKLLEKYIKFMDVLFFITPYDSLFTTDSEINLLKKTLSFIKNENPNIPIIFIVNKIDRLKSEEDKKDIDNSILEATNMIKKMLKKQTLYNKIKFIKISANYINSYRLFDYYKDIKKVSKNSQNDFVEKVLGRSGVKLLENKNYDKLNKKLKQAYVEDNDWKEDYGWNNIKKFIKSNITNDIDLFFFNQFNKLKNHVFDTNDLLNNIYKKLKWIKSYKKNKYFNGKPWLDIIGNILVGDFNKYNFDIRIKKINSENLDTLVYFLNHTFIKKNNWLHKNIIEKIKNILTKVICIQLLKLHNLNDLNIKNIELFIEKLKLIVKFSKECHVINNNFIDLYITSLKKKLNNLTEIQNICIQAILNSFSNKYKTNIIINLQKDYIKAVKLIDYKDKNNIITIKDENIMIGNNNLGEHVPFGNNYMKYKIDLDNTHYDDNNILCYYYNLISSKITSSDEINILKLIINIRYNLFNSDSNYIYKFKKLSYNGKKILKKLNDSFEDIEDVNISKCIKKICRKNNSFKIDYEERYIKFSCKRTELSKNNSKYNYN
jgi:GTPase Era involved in 16S rRNA processing